MSLTGIQAYRQFVADDVSIKKGEEPLLNQQECED